MHPIEWLRAVARCDDAAHADLAGEAASALAALADEPNDLLLACRRLLDRHPDVGALWWVCARMISASLAASEARAIRRDLSSDQVGLNLAVDLPDDATVAVVGASALVSELAERRGDLCILCVAENGHTHDVRADNLVVVPPMSLGSTAAASDVVLIDGWATDGQRFLAASGSLAAAVVARHHDASGDDQLDGHPAVWLVLGVGRRLPKALFEEMRRRVVAAGQPWLARADMVDLALVDRLIEPVAISCPSPPELLQQDSSA